jgi:hypothetical protein
MALSIFLSMRLEIFLCRSQSLKSPQSIFLSKKMSKNADFFFAKCFRIATLGSSFTLGLKFGYLETKFFQKKTGVFHLE